MIEKLPCHDEIVYEIQRAIQTFGPLTAQSLMNLMKRRAQVTASNHAIIIGQVEASLRNHMSQLSIP